MFLPSHIRREGDRVRLYLDAHEQALLRGLLDQLEPMLAEPDDPALRRLFPPAFSEPESDEQYRSLVRDQLVNGRSKALASMRDTLGRESIDLEQADEWLRALNDLRLVLGTRLDVNEEIDYERIDLNEPRGRDLAIYGYLAWLQEQLVDALQPASGR
jgi:hypothetical protein